MIKCACYVVRAVGVRKAALLVGGRDGPRGRQVRVRFRRAQTAVWIHAALVFIARDDARDRWRDARKHRAKLWPGGRCLTITEAALELEREAEEA